MCMSVCAQQEDRSLVFLVVDHSSVALSQGLKSLEERQSDRDGWRAIGKEEEGDKWISLALSAPLPPLLSLKWRLRRMVLKLEKQTHTTIRVTQRCFEQRFVTLCPHYVTTRDMQCNQTDYKFIQRRDEPNVM
jgi:hypothetical protein